MKLTHSILAELSALEAGDDAAFTTAIRNAAPSLIALAEIALALADEPCECHRTLRICKPCNARAVAR